jgi:hypothetical protein
MMDAREILAQAQAVADRRQQAYVPPDYAALNVMVKRQRAALTRAINSGDKDRIVLACRDAVREWNTTPGAIWPDDWSRWQRALDDCLGWRSSVQLEDLCVAEPRAAKEPIHSADCECGVPPCHKPRDQREHASEPLPPANRQCGNCHERDRYHAVGCPEAVRNGEHTHSRRTTGSNCPACPKAPAKPKLQLALF